MSTTLSPSSKRSLLIPWFSCVTLIIFIVINPRQAECHSMALPWNFQASTANSQQQAGASNSDTVAFSQGPGGCSITYYDESLQQVPSITNQLAAYQAAPMQQQPSGSGGASFISSPIQMPPSTPTGTPSIITNPLQQPQPQPQSLTQTQTQPTSIGLDCQFITADQLLDRIGRFKVIGLKVVSLVVKDSNLTALSNLPHGMVHELRRLVISNSSIDLEVLKEGSESLKNLNTLEIIDEKISNIPQNFFQEMSSLKELRLENDGIASLDGDAFHNLDDSLEVLNLKRNRFNRFPMAVKNLAQLAVLDLSDNDIVIDTQENDLPEKLEPLLNLRELAMNRINCTCEFSSSPFFEWIARTHISGVRCFAPEKLKHQEVIVFERDEFCARASGAKLESYHFQSAIILVLCQLMSAIYTARQRPVVVTVHNN